jgi:hypothetical protein
MYAVIREVTVKPGHEVSAEQREEAEAIEAGQAGFYGQLTVDIGAGKFMRIAVWTSEEERETSVNGEDENPIVHVYWSHITKPRIGSGQVISNTLIKE